MEFKRRLQLHNLTYQTVGCSGWGAVAAVVVEVPDPLRQVEEELPRVRWGWAWGCESPGRAAGRRQLRRGWSPRVGPAC